MYRKDYETIAGVVRLRLEQYRKVKDNPQQVAMAQGYRRAVRDMAAALQQVNPSMDSKRFLESCGIEHPVG